MRVPKVFEYKNDELITHVKYDKPIIIPRLPPVTNDRQREKLTKQIESYIRQSMEYKDMIKYLRTYVDMNQCEFFPNIDGRKKNGLIQIHHEPFDLYSLTSIIMNKHEIEYDKIDELVVAEEVMRLHYAGMVGLIPLSVTAHELVGEGKLIIPLNTVYGRFVQFVNDYYDYIDPIYLTMLSEKMELSRNLSSGDLSILKVRYLYSEVEGQSLPTTLK